MDEMTEAAPEQAESMSVTIDKLPDGTFTVSANPGEPQPCGSVEEALAKAGELLGGESGEDAAMAGYMKGAPKQTDRPKVNQVFGESM